MLPAGVFDSESIDVSSAQRDVPPCPQVPPGTRGSRRSRLRRTAPRRGASVPRVRTLLPARRTARARRMTTNVNATPLIYELNARIYGRRFDEITRRDLANFHRLGFSHIWLMGVWRI